MFKANVILEILGSPKEHVEKTMDIVLQRLKDEATIEVVDEEIAPPEEQDELFTMFAELTLTFENTTALHDFCYQYLPSSIEILEPEALKLSATEYTKVLNDLVGILHEHEQKTRDSSARLKVLRRNMNSMLRNFLHFLTEEPKTTQVLSTKVGVPEDQLEPFLKGMEQRGTLKKEGETWKKTSVKDS